MTFTLINKLPPLCDAEELEVLRMYAEMGMTLDELDAWLSHGSSEVN